MPTITRSAKLSPARLASALAVCLILATPPCLAAPAKAARTSSADFRAVIATCLQLINSDQAFGPAAPSQLARVGFHPLASANPYGGEYSIGPSSRASGVLTHEAMAVGEKAQYTFRPAFSGAFTTDPAYAPASNWTLCPVSQGSDGLGRGFFLLYPERGMPFQEVERLLSDMQHLAQSWYGAQIEDNIWVWDFMSGGQYASAGSRMSCYYVADHQGWNQVTIIIRSGTGVNRQPMRGRSNTPQSTKGFVGNIFN